MSTSQAESGNVRLSEPQSTSDLSPKAPVQEVSEQPSQPKPPYTALPLSRQRLILAIITVAGIFGPLAGNIYLPALPVVAREFQRTETEINITVTVFMIVFAFGVSPPHLEVFTCIS